MRQFLRGMAILFLLIAAAATGAAQGKAGTLTCVGLYSETDAGSVSYRVGGGDWVVIKVGDIIPANAVVRVNVDRDWVEFVPSNSLNAVYELHGLDEGEFTKKVADILKGKPRAITFPKGTADKPDPKFKDKLVVLQYLGRQIYTTADGDTRDIKYGDVLDRSGRVTIIAINNTIQLMKDTREVTKVIGPLKFELEKVLTNQKLYKFYNEQK